MVFSKLKLPRNLYEGRKLISFLDKSLISLTKKEAKKLSAFIDSIEDERAQKLIRRWAKARRFIR